MLETLSQRYERLQVRLFGSLRLLYGGADLRFSAPVKTASLLTYLLLHREEKIPREALAFTLWPDDVESKARANLRRHLLLLQRTLPKQSSWTISDHRSIQWNAACDCTVDITEFKRLSQQSETALEATQLYTGDLLADLYEDWLLPQRDLLHRMQSANFERLIQKYRQNREFSKAISAARGLLSHDPWREDAIRTLMSLRYESGDRAGALAEYEEFARRLSSDMNVQPMPESVSLYDSLLGNSPACQSEPGGGYERQRTHVAIAMPFVGRQAELTRLGDWWARAARGNGRCALISGEAGIGKSRLMTELTSIVEAQGGRTVAGSTTFPEATPYQAIIEALRTALPMISKADIKPIWLASATALLPELGHLSDKLPRLVPLEAQRQQDRLFEALVRCFEAIARARPLLVVLEDLHWAGSGTISFLEYFARRLHSLPVFVAATYRHDETQQGHALHSLRRSLRGAGALANLPLGRLTPQSVQECVKGIPQLAGTRPEFAQRVHVLSAGNPFFIGEIVQDSLASELAEPAVSKSLETVIAGRVARLSEDALAAAGVAAVAGRAFDVELLAAASGLPEDKLIECVDELLDLRLIRESGITPSGSYDFMFSHDLIQAHIYASVPQDVRKRRHRRVGLILERLHPQSRDAIARDLARHFDEGGDSRRAVDYYFAAAKNALAVYADREALISLNRVLEMEQMGQQRCASLAMLEAIYGRQGMRPEQLASLEALQRAAEISADEETICECLRRRILYARATDDLSSQQREVEELQKRTASTRSPYWSAVASESAAALLVSTGKCDEGQQRALEALERFEDAEDAAGKVRSLCLIAEACALLANTSGSQLAIDRALVLAEGSSNQALVLRTLCAASLAAHLGNHYGQARDFAQKGLQLSETIGDREAEADCLTRLANIEGRNFVIDAAIEKYSKALAIYQALKKSLGEAIVCFNTGTLFIKIGEHERALESFSRAGAVFSALKDLRGLTVCAINLGMVAYFQRRYATASRLFTRAMHLEQQSRSPHLHSVALANLGAVERETGSLARALSYQEEALRLRRSIAPVDMGSDLADMGLTYLRVGDLHAALRIADEIMALEPADLESVMFPQNVLWIVAQIYGACSFADRRRAVLQRALRMREERLSAIPPGPWRKTYEALPFNQEMAVAGSS